MILVAFLLLIQGCTESQRFSHPSHHLDIARWITGPSEAVPLYLSPANPRDPNKTPLAPDKQAKQVEGTAPAAPRKIAMHGMAWHELHILRYSMIQRI